MGKSVKEIIGLNELSDGKSVGRALIAEFFGIFLLNFYGVAACASGNNFATAFAFGLAVFMAVMTIGHVSGCHINPAVTCGMLVGGHIKPLKAILYIIIQCAGAAAGTGAFRALNINDTPYGLSQLHAKLELAKGFGIEFFLGFVLVLCVYGVCDSNKPDSRFVAPLAIGLTVTLGHIAFIPYTGASMNPARTFGTSLIYNHWVNHWVYWVGPILGGIAAGLLYTQALAAPKCEITITEKYRTSADEKEMRRLDTKGGDYP